jgi:AcrR family transcriptional regulator
MAEPRKKPARARASVAGTARREQQQRTAWEIRDAARVLFLAQGFDGTTTKEIAERAGVAHGTVFLLAPTKEGLLVAALEHHLRGVLSARLATLPARGVAGQIAHLMDGLFDFYAREPALSRAFLRAIMFPADAVATAMYEEHTTAFTARLAALLEAAMVRGELAARKDAARMADAVLGVYVVCLLGFLNSASPDRAALGARFRAGLDALLPPAKAFVDQVKRAAQGAMATTKKAAPAKKTVAKKR